MFLYIAIWVSVIMICITIYISKPVPEEEKIPEEIQEEHHDVSVNDWVVQLKLQWTIGSLYRPPITEAEQFKQNEAIRNQIVTRGRDQTRYQKAYAHYDKDSRAHGPDDYDAFKEAVLKYAPTNKQV